MNFSEPTPSIGNARSEQDPQSDEARELQSIHAMVAELNKWAEELADSAAEEQEKIEKMYYTPLPPALFHATTIERAKSIMQQGLLPHRLIFDEEEVVSLSDTVKYAKFCASVTQGVPEGDLVVLEITTQGLDRELAKSFLHLPPPSQPAADMHEVHYSAPISSDFIYQLSPEETSEIEAQEQQKIKKKPE